MQSLKASWQRRLQQICRRSTPGWTTCLIALIVVVVVIGSLPVEAACAVHIRNMPWELHTASNLQVVCTPHTYSNSTGSFANMSQLLLCVAVKQVLTSQASVM